MSRLIHIWRRAGAQLSEQAHPKPSAVCTARSKSSWELKSSSHISALSNCTPEGQASQVTHRVQPDITSPPHASSTMKTDLEEAIFIPRKVLISTNVNFCACFAKANLHTLDAVATLGCRRMLPVVLCIDLGQADLLGHPFTDDKKILRYEFFVKKLPAKWGMGMIFASMGCKAPDVCLRIFFHPPCNGRGTFFILVKNDWRMPWKSSQNIPTSA